MTEEIVQYVWQEPSTYILKPQPFNIVFHGEDKQEIGKLTIENNELKFEGNADQSAQIFFKYLVEFHKNTLGEQK